MGRNNRDGILISRYISRFLSDYAPVNLTTSEATLRGYRVSLSSYVGWLEDSKNVIPVTFNAACFEASNIEEWLNWMKTEKGNTNDTCNVRLGAIRTFIHYLAKQEVEYRYLAAEASCVRRMKKDNRVINGLSRNAVRSLMEIPDTSTQSGKRYLMLMILLYSLGARLDEILSLRLNDIHLEGTKPCITLTGKGRKVRTLGLLPKPKAHLERYLSEFHKDSSDRQAYLLYTAHKGKYEKISQAAVRKALRKYAEEAHKKCEEVPVTLHAHQFRHAKAEHMLEDGVNIVQISEFLGHSDLDTTKVYLEISDRMKAEAFATIETQMDNASHTKKWLSKIGTLLELTGLGTR